MQVDDGIQVSLKQPFLHDTRSLKEQLLSCSAFIAGLIQRHCCSQGVEIVSSFFVLFISLLLWF